MQLKMKIAEIYENVYDSLRAFSAKRTRIKQFKHKSSRTALTAEQVKEVKNFYRRYKIPNMVFHRFFTEKTGEFHANYIPQDIYVGYIDRYFNDIRAAGHLDNKCYYDQFFHSIPQPRLILKRVNGIWTNGACVPVTDAEIRDIVTNEREGMFVKEAQLTSGGFGVRFIEGGEKAYDEMMEFTNSIATDVVVQGKVSQHPELAKFNDSSVNSLRIYTILQKDGSINPYSAMFRIGVGSSKVDNYSMGGVACGITPDGFLRKYAYNKEGERTDKHPTSGIVFENCKLPSWDKAIDLIRTAHPMIPHFRSVAWDIAIDEKGEPLLIEANLCRGGIDSLQLCNGPLYGDDAQKILDEVFGK